MKIILLSMSIALSGFNVFAADLDCLDHTNTPEEILMCTANAINEALITACGDDTSTSAELEACKQTLRDLCFDHTFTAQEILSCVENNDAI